MTEVKLYKATRYKKLSPKWIKYRDLYEGDHDVVVSNPNYLIPHPLELGPTKEASQLLAARRARTKYMKVPEMIVSIFCSILFREAPSLDDEAKKLLERTGGDKDIDGEQTNFKSFIVEEIAPTYLTYGDVAVLAESFDGQAISAAQEQELGLRPYLKLILPLSFPDWSKETGNSRRLGKFNFARYEYYKEKPRSSELEPIVRQLWTDCFRRSSTGQVTIQKYFAELDENDQPKKNKDQEIQWTVADSLQLNPALDEIPLSAIQKETWIDGVCEETLRFFNLRSELDSNNHFQCYPSTFMFGVKPDDANQYKLMSEYTITFVKDTEARVERLAAQDSAGLERATNESLSTIFKVGLDQVRSLPTDSKAVQGAETISEENRNLYTLLISTIDRLENLTQNALDNFAKLAGEKNFKGKVIFNREIKEEDINVMIKTFNAFKDVLMPIEGMGKAVAKKIIPKLKLDEDEEKELIASADTAKILTPEQKAKQDAQLMGKPKATDATLNG